MPDPAPTTPKGANEVICNVAPIMYGGLMAFKKITGTYVADKIIVTPGFHITHVINLISKAGTTGYYDVATKKIKGLTGEFEMIALGVDN